MERVRVISDIMNRGKVKSTDRIEWPSGEKIRETEDGYKYLEILEYDRIKEQEGTDNQECLFQECKIDFEEQTEWKE